MGSLMDTETEVHHPLLSHSRGAGCTSRWATTARRWSSGWMAWRSTAGSPPRPSHPPHQPRLSRGLPRFHPLPPHHPHVSGFFLCFAPPPTSMCGRSGGGPASGLPPLRAVFVATTAERWATPQQSPTLWGQVAGVALWGRGLTDAEGRQAWRGAEGGPPPWVLLRPEARCEERCAEATRCPQSPQELTPELHNQKELTLFSLHEHAILASK